MIINPGSSTEKQQDAGVGRSMAGQTVEPVQGTTVTAGDQSEIFNRYEPRTYNADGTPASGNVASGDCSHAEGSRTTATGGTSHAEGIATVASGIASHAEGTGAIASGLNSHAEGACTLAASKYASHAEGASSIVANGDQLLKIASHNAAGKTFTFDTSFGTFADAFSHIAVGSKLFVINNYYVGAAKQFTVTAKSSTNNSVTVSEEIPVSNFSPTYAVNISYFPTTGYCSHAEGDRTIATGNNGSHAEGLQTIAMGGQSHAEGFITIASGHSSHVEGRQTKASAEGAHAEGWGSIASATASHAEGCEAVASGPYSHAGGYDTLADSVYQTAIGSCNIKSGNETDRFIIGKGTSGSARANCFRVTKTGTYASGNYNSSGADYAELFEWLDGNPESADRCGHFVTLDGEKIRLAGPEDDFILGIVSGNPSVVGDVHDDQWQGMYLYDVFGRPLWEDVEVPDVTVEEPDPEDPGKTVTRVIIPAHIEHRQRLNPAYDGSQPYLPRTQRPEWDAVGMLGKLVAVDDGTCEVNGWCTVGEGGAATRSAQRTRYRVMARLDECHVRVLIL